MKQNKIWIPDIEEENQANVFKRFTYVVYAFIFLFLVSCSSSYTLEEIKEPIEIEKLTKKSIIR